MLNTRILSEAGLRSRAQKPGVFAWAKSKGIFRQDLQDLQDYQD